MWMLSECYFSSILLLHLLNDLTNNLKLVDLMEDVSFGSGKIIFVDEFSQYAHLGYSIRIIGRVVNYDAKTQMAVLADPDNDTETVRMSTELLSEMGSQIHNRPLMFLGEVSADSDGLFFRPRLVVNASANLDTALYRDNLRKQRLHLDSLNKDNS